VESDSDAWLPVRLLHCQHCGRCAHLVPECLVNHAFYLPLQGRNLVLLFRETRKLYFGSPLQHFFFKFAFIVIAVISVGFDALMVDMRVQRRRLAEDSQSLRDDIYERLGQLTRATTCSLRQKNASNLTCKLQLAEPVRDNSTTSRACARLHCLRVAKWTLCASTYSIRRPYPSR
jgi:hypothetical protein